MDRHHSVRRWLAWSDVQKCKRTLRYGSQGARAKNGCTVTFMQSVWYTFIPVAAAIGGSIIAILHDTDERAQSTLQHISAGIIFAAVALELLPPIRTQTPLIAAIGFLLGIAAMVALRSVTKSFQSGVAAGRSQGFVAASALDVLIDGFLLGATFKLGMKEGILLTVALTLGLLFLSLSVATTLSQAKISRPLIVLAMGGIALAMPLGAALGAIALRNAGPSTLAAILAFGAVVLMYMVTEELLVRAHRVRSSLWAMPLFFLHFSLI